MAWDLVAVVVGLFAPLEPALLQRELLCIGLDDVGARRAAVREGDILGG
jgi:hypothetical protein